MKLRTRILIDARELIADENLWGQGSMESAHERPRRCLSGAICAATGIPEHQIESNPVTADVLQLVSMSIQNRPDAQVKLDKFMTAEDIEHCPPGDNDWLVAFNDYSRHETVIALLDEAIAQSEPCQECEAALTPETFHLLTIGEEPEVILCDQCSLLHDHHEDEEYRYPTTPPPVMIIR